MAIQPISGPVIVLAAGAHPDDIEFMMAGTLLQLKNKGADIHMWNLSCGYCGSNVISSEEISGTRWREACESARLAGATMHEPITRDLELFYSKELLERASSVIRKIRPSIMLVPSPMDYMEDHMTACRLLVSAAFTKGMRNYLTTPPAPCYQGQVAIYHAMPHGLRDSMRKRVKPGQFVDITPVFEAKLGMLAAHTSQKEWLDETQGIDAYLALMERFSREVGAMSGRFACAEGWRRHLHWGYAAEGYDPLSDILGEYCWTDPLYEASLDAT
jgi:LmbE family N-acetylglucosaminyl deacetylase